MRHSGASVQMMHLGQLVSGIKDGELGIPEFQRDFDWSETDIRSLLATVFAGWPAGSLLFLDGRAAMFKLRRFENGPAVSAEPTYVVLDGQQRLTSVFQALSDAGDSIFAVKWDEGHSSDLEEGIISVRKEVWKKDYNSLAQQLERRVIPVRSLISATSFFNWRDNLLSIVAPGEVQSYKDAVTKTYSERLSNIHDYEFPVVLLDRKTEAHAISRIFERVNRTGMKLGAFDLMVAKTFSPAWNLRDKWVEARENYSQLAPFFEEDGMPLLQAIALLEANDVRQSAVLSLPTAVVRRRWDKVAEAADEAIGFLRQHCGVVRRDFMPYPNMLPPLIALAVEGPLATRADLLENWFWNASFSGAYDAAANTRLVAHYKGLAAGRYANEGGLRRVSLTSATKKSERALWTVFNCALVKAVEDSIGGNLPPEIVAEIDISTIYSREEIMGSGAEAIQERSVLNSIIIPKRLSAMARKRGSEPSVRLFQRSEFAKYFSPQFPYLPGGFPMAWPQFRRARAAWLNDHLKRLGVTSVEIER